MQRTEPERDVFNEVTVLIENTVATYDKSSIRGHGFSI